jgi:drug/metabolite transporter (DMT)-like permease
MVHSKEGYLADKGLNLSSEKIGVKQNPWLGASWKILAFSCYAALNAITRYLSGGAQSSLESHLPVNIIIFFQDMFALIIVAPWLIKNARVWQKPRFLGLHLFRVGTSAVAVISWYFALYFLPLADAVALSIIGPMLGVVGAKIYLKEHFTAKRLLILLLTFGLAFAFIRPFSVLSNQSVNLYGLGCVLVSSISFALAKIATRKLASLGESPKLLTAYLLVNIVPVTLIPALFVWVMPSMEHIVWLILAGSLTVLALYAVSTALAYAEVSFLAPFDFIQFFINVSIGYFVFTELPELWAIWLVLAALVMMLTMARSRLSH